MPTDLDAIPSSDSALDRAAASRDLWPGGTLDFWHGERAPGPDRVYWPESEAQVAAILAHCQARGTPVIPFGAGSGVCGGARGVPGAVVLDTKRLDRIGPLDAQGLTVHAQAGVNGQMLEDWLNARGFTLGHSPSSIGCSTVGGWAAARSAGQFSSRYGVFEDMVLQLRAVTPERGVVVVGEGGDAPAEWMGLLLGSEGTLAVITEVRMRVWPLPDKRTLRAYRFPDLTTALHAMRRLMQGELWPSVVRLYDPVDTKIGGKTKPKTGEPKPRSWFAEWLHSLSEVPLLKAQSLAIPLALPGLVNRVFEGLSSGCFLVVGFEGDGGVVDAAYAAGHEICCEQGEDLGPEPGQRWYDSRHAVSYKLMPIFERGGFADTMEVAMRWSDLPRTYAMVRQAVRSNVVVMAHMSHLYPEGGSIYFTFAGRGDRRVYDQAWRDALDAVLRSGATVTHHHGVGSLKAEQASVEVGPAVAGWRALKAALDPRAVMNPGRLYVHVEHVDPGPPPELPADDGLARRGLVGEPHPEAMFPWESLPPPPRWQRMPWHTGWTEVSGSVGGERCLLGRGPRSASGPDLRAWLVEHADEPVTVTASIAPDGPRWMGEGRPDEPWAVAMQLLRSDLRPAVLHVVDGALRVGFRGPAAEAFGEFAAQRVPGGLLPIPYSSPSWPSGPLEPCEPHDEATVWVTATGCYRRGA